MYKDEESIEGTAAALALEYMRLWDVLVAEGDAEELAKLHHHMVNRVLLDATDSADLRMGLAIIVASRCDVVSEALRIAGRPADEMKYSDWKETFERIAQGDEMEVRLTGRDGQEQLIVFEHGARFVRSAGEPMDASTLRWSFALGAPGQDRSSDRYKDLACLSVGPVLALAERELAGAIEKSSYVRECLSIFENVIRGVVFTTRMPSELRRALAGVAFTPYCCLTLPTVATADLTVPLEPDETALRIGHKLGRGDNLICLRKIAMQISNGGSMSAVLRRGDECLMRIEFRSGDRQVVMSHEDIWDCDEEILVEALYRLQSADLTESKGGALDMRPAPATVKGRQRKHPRPNESCSCGSGRKYKRCCGSH